MSLLAILALGFVLGLRHATDSDHVIAVTTIVSRQRTPSSALRVGALWGLGHSVTVLAVGGAMVLCGFMLPPWLGLSLELPVALMLIVLGTLNFRSTLGKSEAPSPHSHLRGPLTLGVVHGLAGSAAIALLALATIKSTSHALLYLSVFGIGTMAGMMLLTLIMGFPLAALSQRFNDLGQRLARVAGAVSIAFGLVLVYQIGVADGLFFGTVNWVPH